MRIQKILSALCIGIVVAIAAVAVLYVVDSWKLVEDAMRDDQPPAAAAKAEAEAEVKAEAEADGTAEAED